MLDEGLGAPEAHGERRDVDGLDELLPGPVAARELEAEHPPEAGHLFPREGVLRERFQPGIVHDADATAAVEEFRQRLGRFRLRRHSKGERLQSPSNEERFEGAECRSQHLVDEPDPVEEVLLRGDDRTGNDVAAAPDVSATFAAGQDRRGDRAHPRPGREAADAPLEIREGVLEVPYSRIAPAGVVFDRRRGDREIRALPSRRKAPSRAREDRGDNRAGFPPPWTVDGAGPRATMLAHQPVTAAPPK